MRAPWTADTPLPGGDFPWDGAEALLSACGDISFMPPATLQRFVRSYGTLTDDLLGDATREAT